MTDDRIPLICSPIDRIPVSGSSWRTCSECGQRVWVSNSMVGKVDASEMRPICIPCAAPIIESGAELAVHKDQTDELSEIGLLGFASRFTAEINRNPQRWFDYEPGARRIPDPFDWDSRRSPERRGNRAHRRAQGD
jgi:hypothetical protein